MVTIGVLLALFAGVSRYVDQHFFNQDTFVENTTTLATNATIRERLFDGFREGVIAMADGETEVDSDALLGSEDDDEDEGVVLDPVTAERNARDEAIEQILLDVFDSQLYSRTFDTALAKTQTQLVASAELEPEERLRNKGEVFFDMSALNNTIYNALASDERTALITQNEVPADLGVFKLADRETTIDLVWTFLSNGSNWRGLTLLGAIMAFVGAVVLSDRRPTTVIQFGGGLVGVGVVAIVVIYLIRFMVPLLAGGGSASSAVAATYAANLWPLVRVMIRLAILGLVMAAAGGIARMVWPDDWVYSSVSDDRGVRSIQRRRGTPDPTPQQQPQVQVPAAASVPVGYGYPQQPYGAYPQQWGQPYPGQVPPGYPMPYPNGPYAQPMQPGQVQGQPTVPVMPVYVEQNAQGQLVPPPAPDLDPADLPDDAAQAVPKVVTSANGEQPGNDTVVQSADAADSASAERSKSSARATTVDAGSGDADSTNKNEHATVSSAADSDGDGSVTSQELLDHAKDQASGAADDWADEKDW